MLRAMRPLFASSVRPRCAALAVVVALAGFLASPPASAQAPSSDRRPRAGTGDKKEALRRLADGDRKLQRGDKLAARGKIEQAFAQFEAALVDYQAAFEAYSDPQIYFPIAQAEQRLGRFVDALQHYQDLLSDSKALSPQLRTQVQARLDEVRKNLAALVLEIEPSGADVVIDGKPAGRSPMSQPIFIEPGQHSYEISRSGYRTEEGKVDLMPGKELRRRVRLDKKTEVVRRPARRPLPRPVVAVEGPSSVPVWIGVGVTSALVIGGTVTGIGAASKHSQYEDASLSFETREAARTDGKRLARITDIALGGAIVTGAATAWYYFAVYRPRASEAEEVAAQREALRVEPVVGPDRAGLAVSGTFW
jgi:tetratricopeptide (TPR) repeat protein